MGSSMLSSVKQKKGRSSIVKAGIETFRKPFSPVRRRLLSGSLATRTSAMSTPAIAQRTLLMKEENEEEEQNHDNTTTTTTTLLIDTYTEKAMRIEVIDLLDARYDHGHPSVCAVASAIATSSSVLTHYTNSSYLDIDIDHNDHDTGTRTRSSSSNSNTSSTGGGRGHYGVVSGLLQNLSHLSLKEDTTRSTAAVAVHQHPSVRHKARQRQFQKALKTLETQVGSSSQTISSWEEAKEVLATVVTFTVDDEKEQQQEEETQKQLVVSTPFESTSQVTTATTTASSTQQTPKLSSSGSGGDEVQQYLQRIQEATRKLIPFTKGPSYSKWRQIAQTTLPRKFSHRGHQDVDDEKEKKSTSTAPELISTEEDHHDDMTRKLDDQQRQRTKDMLANRDASMFQSGAVQRLEDRITQQELEQEAQEKASDLLTPLTTPQRKLVEEAIYGEGSPTDIIAQVGTDSVQRASMSRLAPGQWLNDEVIHYFMVMLSNRDEQLTKRTPGRKRSHFFKSFFMTKLLDEGNANPAKAGKYNYKNVKRWSKKVPGKDVFQLDKIFFPINVGGVHWVCAVAYMTEHKLQMYDSMGSDGMQYLHSILEYLKDEHLAKKHTPLPHMEEWTIVGCTSDTPTQRNGFDCGVFTCMFADFLSTDCPLVFSQNHINQCRERIALSIMNGSAII